MKNFLKKLLGIKEKIEVWDEPDHIEMEKYTLDSYREEPREEPKEEIKENKITKKDDKINERNEKMPTIENQLWMVTLDTTNRVEVRNFPKGILNFWFVWANNEDECKSVVWASFGNRQNVIAELQHSIKCTPLKLVVGKMSQRANFWSYIPRGNQRLPGQQSYIPDPTKLLARDQYGQESAQTFIPSNVELPEEIAQELLNDAMKDDIETRRELGISKSSTNDTTNQNSNDQSAVMMQMMQMMQTMKEELDQIKNKKTRKTSS